jgi:hypothetical protein
MELWLFAAFGTCLQFGVLAYSGFATYHPALKFQKDDKSIKPYAYPCTAVETLVLVLGMVLCGHVVESSTDEKKYEAVDGRKARMVWLQQTKTVSDQVFNSYMVFAKGDRQTITTSRRSSKRGKNRSPATHSGFNSSGYDDPSIFLNIVTTVGTGIALCGFVLQFVGLRGMHWSASIAQLGAVVVMVGVKAWVRRGLAKSPACEPLPSGFELDWFTTSLGDIFTEAWISQKNRSRTTYPRMLSDSDTRDRRWGVLTGGNSNLYVCDGSRVSAPWRSDERISDAQWTLNIRKSLAHLAGWSGPASSEAVSLARAMECTMNALDACFPGSSKSSSWKLETSYRRRREAIHIPLSKEIGGWKVDASEIEAILSLWLSSVQEDEYLQDQYNLLNARIISKLQQPKSQDEWLRSEATIAKRSLRLFGESTTSLVRDLRWWVPNDLLDVRWIEEVEVLEQQISHHPVVGYHYQRNWGSRQYPNSLQSLGLENSGLDDLYGNRTPEATIVLVNKR